MLVYAPTPYSDREHFTICHEIGHHLISQEDDEDILVWFADQPEGADEEICDLIAAQLLVHPDDIDAVLDGGGPSGPRVLGLFQSTNASRQVAAIAMAQRLPCEGFVAVIRDGAVSFAARQGDTRPYAWRGDSLPEHHPVGQLEDGQGTARESYWPTPWGEPRRYYLSAKRDGAWTYAVFAEHDLFGAVELHLPEAPRATSADRHSFRCPSCGHTAMLRRWPCPDCHEQECPKCEACGCTRKEAATKRAMCSNCTRFVRADLIIDGLCDGCR